MKNYKYGQHIIDLRKATFNFTDEISEIEVTDYLSSEEIELLYGEMKNHKNIQFYLGAWTYSDTNILYEVGNAGTYYQCVKGSDYIYDSAPMIAVDDNEYALISITLGLFVTTNKKVYLRCNVETLRIL